MLSVYRLAEPLPGEKVITVIHRDALIVLKRIVLFLVLLALPVVLLLMLQNLFPSLLETALVWPLILLAASAYTLFIWLLLFFSIIDYLLDIWVITDQRIIDVKQNGFFSRVIAEQRLSRIQDVMSETKGFWPTIFKYGTVIVQTASQNERISFEEVSHPERVRDLLIRVSSPVREAEPVQHSTTPVPAEKL